LRVSQFDGPGSIPGGIFGGQNGMGQVSSEYFGFSYQFSVPMRSLDFSIYLILPALGSTQPLTEMSTRNLPRGKGRPARWADNLTAVCEPNVYKMWDPRRLTTLWVPTACYRDSFTFFYHISSKQHFYFRLSYENSE
jgi:hypothetical protein